MKRIWIALMAVLAVGTFVATSVDAGPPGPGGPGGPRMKKPMQQGRSGPGGPGMKKPMQGKGMQADPGGLADALNLKGSTKDRFIETVQSYSESTSSESDTIAALIESLSGEGNSDDSLQAIVDKLDAALNRLCQLKQSERKDIKTLLTTPQYVQYILMGK